MDDSFQNKSSKAYQCQFCEVNIDRNYKEDHYSICAKFESFITDHICEFCDKVFDNNIVLKKHIRRIHSEPKNSKKHENISLKSFEETKLEALTLMKSFKTKNDAMKFFDWIRDDALEEMKNSVGSNPNITNFEPLQIRQVELRTHSNPGSSTKTELRTLANPSKKPNLRTCLLARNGLNPEKPNFEPTQKPLQKT